jgi:replicative DNA helicase
MFNELIQKVDEGRLGLNKGLPHRFNKLLDYIPNIQKETYFTIGGDLGTGKTSFVDDMFVQTPLELKTTENVFILYFSLEVSKIAKLCKFISRRMFIDYRIEVDTNFILSKGKNRISDDIYRKVVQYADYFNSIEDNLLIYDDPINPTGIRNKIINVFKQKRFGIIETGTNNEMIVKFNPTYSNTYFIVVIDHIGLMSTEQGFNKKENIDQMSKYLINLRNKLKISPVVVNQFNRSIDSTDRHKLSMVMPKLTDFSDTASTQQDANIVLALFHPYRYGIDKLTIDKKQVEIDKNTRGLFLLKNRDGADDCKILLDFNGKVGYFKEK